MQASRITQILAQPAQPAATGAPLPLGSDPSAAGTATQSQPPAAFTWGADGRMILPDQLARDRSIAQLLGQPDFSPVQSPWQGAARAAGNIIAALEDRHLAKREAANIDHTRQIAALLAVPHPDRSAVISALADPYVSPEVRALAVEQDQASRPQAFTAGHDRVSYDPTTGKSTVIYHGASDAEQYAQSLGAQPGTPDYLTALRDYTLRGEGPTALAGREELEGVRQDGRVALEGDRQRNRLSLRSTPTYSDLHPHTPAHAVSGAQGGPPRSTGSVYAPILAKVARGEPLTPGEQQVYVQYHGHGGGRGGAGAGASSGGSLPTVATPADAMKLPSGTSFRTPDGRIKVRP